MLCAGAACLSDAHTRGTPALLTHLQPTNSQDTLPEMGKKIASKANRASVAERFPDPAVHQSVAGDLALIACSDQ